MASPSSLTRVYTVREGTEQIPLVSLKHTASERQEDARRVGLQGASHVSAFLPERSPPKRSPSRKPRKEPRLRQEHNARKVYPTLYESDTDDHSPGVPEAISNVAQTITDGVVHEIDAERDALCCPCSCLVRLEIVVGLIVGLVTLVVMAALVTVYVLPLFGETVLAIHSNREYNCTDGKVDASLSFAMPADLAEFDVFVSFHCKALVFDRDDQNDRQALLDFVRDSLVVPEPRLVTEHQKSEYSWHGVVFLTDFNVGEHVYTCAGVAMYKRKINVRKSTLVAVRTSEEGSASLSFSAECRIVHLTTAHQMEPGFERLAYPPGLGFSTMEFARCDVPNAAEI